MKLLPIISLGETKPAIPRATLQHLGQVLIVIAPETLHDSLKFISAHSALVSVIANVKGLAIEEVAFVLNAGAKAVICTDMQATEAHVPADRRITAILSKAEIDQIKPEEDAFLFIEEPTLEELRNLPASATLVTSAANLKLPETTDSAAPPSLGDSAGSLDIAEAFSIGMQSDRMDGLFPTVVCNEHNQALGLVYSSPRSIAESLRTGTGVYESRKRGLWYKGATSGDTQKLLKIAYDCDADCLHVKVRQTGRGFCHLPQSSCFGALSGLTALEKTLVERKASAPAGSYTKRLFDDSKLLRAKILEEAEELCDATTKQEVAFEAADLIYFALTHCIAKGVTLLDVEHALDAKALKLPSARRPGNAKQAFADKITEKEAETVAKVKALGDDPPIDDRESLNLKVHDLRDVSAEQYKALLRRPIKSNDEINNLVKPILQAVRTRGDAAVLELTKRFDGAALQEPVLRAPFDPALMQLSPNVQASIDQAFSNIRAFHQAQLDNDQPISVETMPGVICSRFNRPIERVACYIPGGTAVLPSTAMMLGVPAMVAQCPHILFASPPRKDGSLSPEIVYIAHKVGAEAILLAGGAQAVAALAYGTESVLKCDKILGPGNQFVTAAKSLVAGDAEALVSIDMPAGPSEVLIICDGSANPAFVASDLLSQAEHGADSQSVLVGASLTQDEVDAIKKEVVRQANLLPRVDILKKSIAHSYICNASSIDEAVAFSNAYAPEHLIVYTKDSAADAKKIMNAGSIFVGPYSPVACGDYASGTNHTLPTYGYARQYSGVNTGSFLKAITSQEITREGLGKLGPVVMQLADVEGLAAHKNSVQVRLD